MRKPHKFRRGIATAMVIMTAIPQTQIPVFAETTKAAVSGEVKVNPQIHYQTLEGWGTSLCWWGNVIGAVGGRDFNGNGIPDREEIAELAFSPEYLNLNIVRYNVGGGDKPDSSIKRVEGRVPGWTVDMLGKDSADGSNDFQNNFKKDEFYNKPAEEMNDAGQIWMLEQANRWRAEEGDIINEVFSNSPPYYMTKSGSSTGGYAWDEENLKSEHLNDFCTYLARATKWLDQNLKDKYGTGIDYVEPLNEPDTSYWHDGSTKQEGCIFYPGASQWNVYNGMRANLDKIGLEEVKLTGTDETSLDKAIHSYENLGPQARKNLDVISAHTYGGNDTERAKLRDIAASYDKGLWMSEVTKGGGNPHNEWSHTDMWQCQAHEQSKGIMSDLKNMQSTAWIAWLVADSEYECIQTNQNWGLIHYVFEEDGPVPGYHTNLFDGDGSWKDGLPNAGYWAVTKQFYTMMQYSKYLKAGYTMIEIGDGNMCAAVSPNRDELVIVAQNFEDGTRDTSIDLSQFPGAADVKLFRTTSGDSENCTEVETAPISEGVLGVSLPEWSVSTYVITGHGDALYEENRYKTIVSSNVEVTEDTLHTGADDMDKFTYEGEWGDGWQWDTQEKYTTDPASTATFKFSGVQASLYGKTSSNGAELLIQVDGGDAVSVSAYSSDTVRRNHLYTTPALSDGEHTVTVRMAEDQTAGSPEIVLEYAEIVHGQAQVTKPLYSKETLAANDYVLYTVNCGTPDSGVLPNTDSEKWGLLQSNMDQAYGADAKTGMMWGRDPDTEYSKAVNDGQDANDIGASYIYMADDVVYDRDRSSLGYSFELPENKLDGIDPDTYEVTVAFKHWWDARPVDVFLEEEPVETGIWLGYGEWVSKTYTTDVTDGILNVQVKNQNRSDASQDPILNYIKVRAVNAAYSISGTVKAAQSESVEGIEMKLYNGGDTSVSEPAATVKTDVNGAYMFKNLETGTYSVVFPAMNGHAEIVRTIEIKNADAAEINFTLGSEGMPYTKEELEQNDYVLYTVNCGTPDPSVIPNPGTERLGLMQSKVDQAYGADAVTGKTWGRDPDTEYSAAWNHGDDATDIGNSFIYMADHVTFDKDKSSLGYSFELPQGVLDGIDTDTYEVTVAFKHWWDERWVNISLEDQTVATDVGIAYDSWVSKTFTTEVTDGVLNVQVRSPRRNSTKQDPILNYIKVRAVKENTSEPVTYDSITGVAGDQMYDTNGKLIQAHGGQIQQLTVDGETKWYWIGEDKTNDYRPVGGIHVYSSTDLYNWDDEGVVLRTMESMEEFTSDPYFAELYGDYTDEQKKEIFIDLDKNNCVMERPKMIYNEKNDNYVIWFHADGRYPGSDADYGKAKAGVAVSDSPTGPFKLLGSYKLNYHDDPNADHGYDGWGGRGSVRDMNLFVDDDQAAYVIYSSEGNRTTFVSRLNEDYTALAVDRDEAVEGEHFTRNFIGWSREAPAMFKYNDKYYMIGSGCTGWSPNPAGYAVADHPMGPWTWKGDPCNGWESDTTFRTQSTCVFPVDAENGKYIYMGDRWNAGYLRDSRYVWLPVEFWDDDRMVLYRYENWTLDELNGKGLAKITSEIPTRFTSLAELEAALPDTADGNIGGVEFTGAAVKWDPIDTEQDFIGTYRATGRLTELDNRVVSHKVQIVDKNMMYFFDSGAETSEYLDALQEEADLKNEEVDQPYTEEDGAGYTGTKYEDFGLRVGHGAFGNGWWAEDDKAIEYRFDGLKPGGYTVYTGYQEWWSVERDMKVSAALLDQEGNETLLEENTFTLRNNETGMVHKLDITVPEAEKTGDLLVRIEKTGGSDAVLAFIGIGLKEARPVTYRISGTVSSEQQDVSVEGIELKLYKGDDISLASPSDAVLTDAEGGYSFDGLENGRYSVELPAMGGQNADVKTVEIRDADVTDVNFTVGNGGSEPVTYKISGTVTDEKEGTAVEGIRLKLHKGDDISLASPSDAVWTDAEGSYAFEGLEDGIYSIEVPAMKGYEADAATVEIDGADVEHINFILTRAEEEEDEYSIEVTALPDKQKYFIGDVLEPAGLEVTLYKNGEAERVLEEEEYEISGWNLSSAGTKEIRITYEEAGKTYTASFKVTVYEALEDASIKVVRVPDKLVYLAGEELDPSGMEIRGKNVGDEAITILSEGDYEVEYDFEEPGTAIVTILYLWNEDGLEAELTDTFEVLVLDPEAELYTRKIRITEAPYQTVYEVGDSFEPEGMVVERTVEVQTFELASASNATFTETVPLEELDIEAEEFDKTGRKAVVVSLSVESEGGEEVQLSDMLTVTVTKSALVIAENALEATLRRLEEALAYGEYLTEEEKKEALAKAAEEMAEVLETYHDGTAISRKAFDLLLELEQQIREAYPNILSSVQADSRFGSVDAEGLALNADMESDDYQKLVLKIEASDEEIPSHIKEEVKNYVAMEIGLYHGEEEITLKMPIRISMRIPEGLDEKNLVIYHFHNGEWTVIHPTVSGSRMNFIVSDLSLFVAANTKQKISASGSSGSGSRINWNTGFVKSGPGYTIPGTWKQDTLGWWYEKSDGTYIRSSWARINGRWYYFNEQGYMMTGWITVDGKTYYLNTDGSLMADAETSMP